MPGGIIQLAVYGGQDYYLTSNPQISFFKSVYRRHTNFSMEFINLLPENMLAADGCNSIARKLNSYLYNSSEPLIQGKDIVDNLNDDTIITWFHILVPVLKIGSNKEFPVHELIFINFYGKNIVLQGYCEFYSIYVWKEWLVSDYETNQSDFGLLKTILKQGIDPNAILLPTKNTEIQISKQDFKQLYTTIIFPENFTSNIENIIGDKIDRINLIKTTSPENLVIESDTIKLIAAGKLIAPPRRRPLRRFGVSLAALEAAAQDPPPPTPQVPE